jgi:hypothetical protein
MNSASGWLRSSVFTSARVAPSSTVVSGSCLGRTYSLGSVNSEAGQSPSSGLLAMRTISRGSPVPTGGACFRRERFGCVGD